MAAGTYRYYSARYGRWITGHRGRRAIHRRHKAHLSKHAHHARKRTRAKDFHVGIRTYHVKYVNAPKHSW